MEALIGRSVKVSKAQPLYCASLCALKTFIWEHIEMSEIHALNIQQKSVNNPALSHLN